jgi:hypothetical protein
MAEFTIKKWRCDRCAKVEDKRPSSIPRPRVVLSYDWPEGPGPSITWRELCAPCTKYAEALVDREIAALKGDTP